MIAYFCKWLGKVMFAWGLFLIVQNQRVWKVNKLQRIHRIITYLFKILYKDVYYNMQKVWEISSDQKKINEN